MTIYHLYVPYLKFLGGGAPSLSKQQMFKDQPVEALRDPSKLLESVRAQEKKYGDRLSPHSNFYRRHIMVQKFLQIQLTTGPSQTRRSFSCNVARSFGRGTFTARNIVRWENLWVGSREIPERKERDDYDSWVYDGDLNDAMSKFAGTQGDSKYCLG